MSEKMKIQMNMDDLTFGELEEFENITGLILSEAMKSEIVRDPKTGQAVPDPEDPKGRPLRETRMSVKTMMGLVYIVLKRDNPDITFDEVKKIRVNDIDFDILEVDEGKEENEE